MNIDFLKKLYQSRLVKSGIWFTIGTFFIQGISFITMPIFTRMLGTTGFGIVNVYTTWLSVFTTLITLGLLATVNNAKVDFKEKYDEFASSILFLATLFAILWFIFAFIFKKQIGNIINLNSILVMCLIIQSFFGFVVDFSNAKLNAEYKYKKFLLISISNAILNTILAIILIYSLKTDKYYGRIGSLLIVALLYGTVLYIIAMRKGKKLINFKYWKYALILSIPAIVHLLSGVILQSVDTVMINSMLGSSAAGIYSFAYKIGMIMYIVWLACNKAWVPWFYENMKEKNYDDIRLKIKYYIALFSVMGFVLIFISPEIGKLMGSSDFYGGLNYVPLIMVGYYFQFLYSIPANLEFYTKNTKLLSLGTLIAALTNVVLNYIMIPRYGAIAATWTTIIAYVILFLYHYFISIRIFDVRIYTFKPFAYGIISIVLSSIMFYIVKNNLILRYAILITILVILGYQIKKISKRLMQK
ncbi:oligosaccharide flippase family protein [Clostridium estertheticum]|uniref:Oligosaccharide flippase family protein n=1 Tax=Clostridium estertheticum TaxID=238834 RepID=A0AA47EN29_9CLOT|nr:oligosaccharide flippase family protein [Clostridium estertheticum]MBU3154817.1 oligosaccharide flippase family protein [Clostridium estertheticum]MBU3198953.1 oligosaccharide flippase family protein [Clostridium estertheticum]WAG61608.1 oligosaccharide flippase family protein [Clostridium estertheticum]WAG64262.1 oligosaccharide flippase family protein [Clostridium estertheticum]